MKTIKKLVELLRTLPELDICPDIDVDMGGDLVIEWHYYPNNNVILTIPTDGSEPYITWHYSTMMYEGSTTHDLSRLKDLVSEAARLEEGKE